MKPRSGRQQGAETLKFTAEEELDLTATSAWSEIVLTNEGSTETWRLHLALENDSWKVCDAELSE